MRCTRSRFAPRSCPRFLWVRQRRRGYIKRGERARWRRLGDDGALRMIIKNSFACRGSLSVRDGFFWCLIISRRLGLYRVFVSTTKLSSFGSVQDKILPKKNLDHLSCLVDCVYTLSRRESFIFELLTSSRSVFGSLLWCPHCIVQYCSSFSFAAPFYSRRFSR